MRKILYVGLIALLAVLFSPDVWAQNTRVVADCGAVNMSWTANDVGRPLLVDTTGKLCNAHPGDFPTGAAPVTASTTGTTGATAAALGATASITNYICGFSVQSNATAALTGNITVVGTISATMNFTHWHAPLASGIGITEKYFYPCLPASAVNTAITVTGPAPGAGGTISTTVWGYRK